MPFWPFAEARKPRSFKRRVVDERVLSTTVKDNEAVTSLGVEPLHARLEISRCPSQRRFMTFPPEYPAYFARSNSRCGWKSPPSGSWMVAATILKLVGEISVTVVVREMPFHCGKVHC